jgi:hypothetical protein
MKLELNNWHKTICELYEVGDIYFLKEYYHLYEKLGEGNPHCFIYKAEKEIAYYPFLINSINNLGYNLDNSYFDIQGAYGYNGVISNSNEFSFITSFYKTLDKYCQNNNIIAEFTRFHPLLKNEIFSQNHMEIIYDRETVFIDLKKSYQEIWDSDYTSNNRNMIRKAKKMDYKIKIINEPTNKDLDTFISIYEFSMLKAHATDYYFFNREYFSDIFNFLPGNSFLLNVLDSENVVVCSSIFLFYGDYFHYHLSGKKASADNSVNNFIIDQAIIFAQKLGAKYFHLGGGRSRLEDDSLLKFKKNFSKQIQPFYIGKKIHNQKIYNEVVRQWEERYPEKKDKFQNVLLKYRY